MSCILNHMSTYLHRSAGHVCRRSRADHSLTCVSKLSCMHPAAQLAGRASKQFVDLLQALPRRAHSWEAGSGDWVTLDDFARAAHSDPYCALLGCESWQVSTGRPSRTVELG